MTKKVLVIGGSGLLGSSLAVLSAKEFETIATYNIHAIKIRGCKTHQLDIIDKKRVFSLMKSCLPDVVIHTAALVDANLCEIRPKTAWEINVLGTKNLAEACNEINAKMIYTSTNYIFGGDKGNYNEESIPNPKNYYAKTKLEGETVVKEEDINYVIARVSPYGWNIQNKLNYVTWVIDKLEKKEQVNAFTDQYNSPILANNCADALLALFKYNKKGIYHVAGIERINRFDFAKKIAEIFELDKKLIKPVISDKIKQIAERPKDTSLDISKAKKELNMDFLGVEEGLKKMKELKDDGYMNLFETS